MPNDEVVNETARPEGTLRRYAGMLVEIRNLHLPFPIYDYCNHPEHLKDDDSQDKYLTVELDDGVATCPESYVFPVCEHCCRCCGERTTQCEDNHEHGPGKPICPTMAILRGQ
jgi:hypothetical protein